MESQSPRSRDKPDYQFTTQNNPLPDPLIYLPITLHLLTTYHAYAYNIYMVIMPVYEVLICYAVLSSWKFS